MPSREPISEPALPARRPGLYSTYVGKKYAMAVSGMVLMLFVLAHMIGNLKLYLGASSLDSYAAWLRDVGEPALPRETLLWTVRIVLIAAVAVHIHAAYVVTLVNRRAPARWRTDRRATTSPRACEPDDALVRDHRRAVRRPPPARPHVGHGEPGSPSRRSVLQRGRELPALAGGDRLHRRERTFYARGQTGQQLLLGA